MVYNDLVISVMVVMLMYGRKLVVTKISHKPLEDSTSYIPFIEKLLFTKSVCECDDKRDALSLVRDGKSIAGVCVHPECVSVFVYVGLKSNQPSEVTGWYQFSHYIYTQGFLRSRSLLIKFFTNTECDTLALCYIGKYVPPLFWQDFFYVNCRKICVGLHLKLVDECSGKEEDLGVIGDEGVSNG